ncbi:hypothetical protein PV325_013745 [Microctonus aethiopoides]|uniref:Uncharacterized protein n=1 Tax=Microctonus aethiopoides TaxID=144406 RepID=A0AA39FAY8_9HYME|nr:hypothetical protein PV325_013745 [Microctonus aethiopoides]KAK0098111.1 hypothetical protein PV326_011097 [Microctonus aethiopoides]KAK0166153.1 hypothetical protein PV328_004600 [Microctonus aethiopoides]
MATPRPHYPMLIPCESAVIASGSYEGLTNINSVLRIQQRLRRRKSVSSCSLHFLIDIKQPFVIGRVRRVCVAGCLMAERRAVSTRTAVSNIPSIGDSSDRVRDNKYLESDT